MAVIRAEPGSSSNSPSPLPSSPAEAAGRPGPPGPEPHDHGGLVARVHALDARIDAWIEPRRSRALDRLCYGLSSAADHGLLWGAIGAVRAARTARPADALRLGKALTVESLLTNGPIKAAFRRARPGSEHPIDKGPLPYGMHRPLTSSFPSGHAVTAFSAATILSEDGAAPVWFALAALVAASRVYTRMHHASDVVAGAALGLAMGALSRRLLARPR